jgi:hypothetical protein
VGREAAEVAAAPSGLRQLAVPVALGAGSALYVLGIPDNPPGFHVDESAIAYNALSIAESGRDEHGAAWPTFFESYGDWKSAPYIYLLAAVLKVTGPSITTARVVSALVVLAAVVVIAVLVARACDGWVAGAGVGISALLTPWLFETGRLVFEAVLVPVTVAAVLLVLHRASRHERWPIGHVAGIGLLLGLLTYSYQSGRLLGPALALGLVLFRNRRNVGLTWAMYGLALVPLLAFAIRHPGALGARFETASYVDDGGSMWNVLRTFGDHYLTAFSPSGLLIDGDENARHHVHAMGSMLAATVALALVGLAAAIRDWRTDRWWRFVVFGLVVAPIPGALSIDSFHALRLVAVPVFVLVLAGAGIELLRRSEAGRGALVALLIATVVQGAVFQVRFHDEGDERVELFDAEYPAVLDAAPGRLYSLHGTHAHCLWYSALEGGDRRRCVRVPDEGIPPGSTAASQFVVECARCRELRTIGTFGLYRIDQRLPLD